MGCRAVEGDHQLKPESFFISLDENGQKYTTLSFNKCKNKTQNCWQKKQRKPSRIYLWEAWELIVSCHYIGQIPPNTPAFSVHPKEEDYTVNLWQVNKVTSSFGYSNWIWLLCDNSSKLAVVNSRWLECNCNIMVIFLTFLTIYAKPCLQSTTIQKLPETNHVSEMWIDPKFSLEKIKTHN